MTETRNAFPFCLVSGFRPLGDLHIGHFGAVIRDIIELQHARPNAACVFVADHHARSEWRSYSDVGFRHIEARSIRVARQLLALGIDPEFTTIYRQSDVPLVFELLWLLAGIGSDGQLRRGHAFKTSDAPTVGTYLYPMLMVADIVGMKATNVAIGSDQAQHLELARDVSRQLVRLFGQDFVPVPESIRSPTATVRGYKCDGKMDLTSQNAICIFESTETVDLSINRIRTSVVERGECLPAEGCRILEYAEAIGGVRAKNILAENYCDATFRYSHAKESLRELFYQTYESVRERQKEITSDEVRDWLATGAVRARRRMTVIVDELREHLGVGCEARQQT